MELSLGHLIHAEQLQTAILTRQRCQILLENLPGLDCVQPMRRRLAVSSPPTNRTPPT